MFTPNGASAHAVCIPCLPFAIHAERVTSLEIVWMSSEPTPSNIVQVERFSKRHDKALSHASISAFSLQFELYIN